MTNVIETRCLTKDYGGRRGVFDLSLAVREGEIFGFLGPNGAGKTTTIRHLMGFIRPDSGEARVLDMDCFSRREEIQKRLGYLPGEPALIGDMTGEEYFRFISGLRRGGDKRRILTLAERFELNTKIKIRKMSKGTKQKVSIVTAFMGNPDVYILDEPTSGLDPLMQNRFIDLVLEEKAKGATVLLSSHIFDEVEKTCDRTAILRAGELVEIEDMQALKARKSKRYTVTLKSAEAARALAAQCKGRVLSTDGARVTLLVRGEPGDMLVRIAEADPIDLSVDSQSLEELFLHYYKEETV